MITPSLELATQLKEAGFQQWTWFCWYKSIDEWKIGSRETILPKENIEFIAAPTAEEILEKIPYKVYFDGKPYKMRILRTKKKQWDIKFRIPVKDRSTITLREELADSLVDAAARMYLYLKENNLIQEVEKE